MDPSWSVEDLAKDPVTLLLLTVVGLLIALGVGFSQTILAAIQTLLSAVQTWLALRPMKPADAAAQAGGGDRRGGAAAGEGGGGACRSRSARSGGACR